MQVQRQIDRLLAQRAAEWIETLKDGDRSDHDAFVEWLQQSKLHVEHYLDMECLERQIRLLDPTKGPRIDALLAAKPPNVVPLEGPGILRPRRQQAPWRSRAAAAVALGIVALGALGYYFNRSAHRVATTTGEQRTLTLPDGSLVLLNVETDLRIDYNEHHRNITLAAGEAVFKVAADPTRPFIVHTRTADIRALGTEFNVYQRRFTVVSVLEGRVQLSTQPATALIGSQGLTENLVMGEEASITTGRIEKRAHPDVGKTAAWRERRLYFSSTPLTEIVREFNRYGGPVKLEVEGIGEEAHRFDGTFNADDPEALADILQQQDDLVVDREPGEIRVRPRAR